MVHASFGRLGAILLVGMAVSSAALAAPDEVGYRQGSLGVSALLAADYQTAEAQLNRLDGVTPGDPLRLINLGNVYAGTGRPYEAQKAFLAVLKREPVEVTTADGGATTTHAIARTALRRLRAATASR